MAYPTEMTLTSGTVAYAADPDSDEKIRSREVRVSVTFQIEDNEADLSDLAHVKMAEVEKARVAAQDRIERDLRDPYGAASGDGGLFGADDPSLEPPDEGDACPFPEEADYLIAHGGRDHSGVQELNGVHGRNGNHPPASTVTQTAPAWVPPAETATAAPPETDWATRPQVLALGSHFRRLGIGPADQTALLRERFGKFRPERLTKAEAAQLMRSLERGELETEPAGSVPADMNGRHTAAPA